VKEGGSREIPSPPRDETPLPIPEIMPPQRSPSRRDRPITAKCQLEKERGGFSHLEEALWLVLRRAALCGGLRGQDPGVK
jgi:hypothetical protein